MKINSRTCEEVEELTPCFHIPMVFFSILNLSNRIYLTLLEEGWTDTRSRIGRQTQEEKIQGRQTQGGQTQGVETQSLLG